MSRRAHDAPSMDVTRGTGRSTVLRDERIVVVGPHARERGRKRPRDASPSSLEFGLAYHNELVDVPGRGDVKRLAFGGSGPDENIANTISVCVANIVGLV